MIVTDQDFNKPNTISFLPRCILTHNSHISKIARVVVWHSSVLDRKEIEKSDHLFLVPT